MNSRAMRIAVPCAPTGAPRRGLGRQAERADGTLTDTQGAAGAPAGVLPRGQVRASQRQGTGRADIHADGTAEALAGFELEGRRDAGCL